MAFKDANGRITIDEVAAQRDIANIQAAIEDLKLARDSVKEIRYQSQSFSGKTAIALEGSSGSLTAEYDKMITQLEETVSLIIAIVEKYRRIDEEVKNMINNQG